MSQTRQDPAATGSARHPRSSRPLSALTRGTSDPVDRDRREHTTAESAVRVGRNGAGAGAGRAHLGRAGLALVVLVGVVVGIPVVLNRLGAALPVPGPGELLGSSVLRADDGGLLLVALLLVAWVAWAAVVVSLAVELVAVVRRVPSPRVPGLAVPQRLAGWMVASLMLALVPVASVTPAHGLALDRVVEQMLTAEVDGGPRLAHDADGQAAEPGASQTQRVALGGPAEGRPGAPPTVQTKRHDTLWLLAEQHLGAGERYPEILALNVGVPQPDGRELGRDGRIYPGWVLTLPDDATVDAPRPARVVVAQGDTLWDIAGDELGDPRRYRELFADNRGDLQPDGQRLSRASLIQPGWVITMPADTADGPGAHPGDDESSGGKESPVGASKPEPSGEATQAIPSLDRGSKPDRPASVGPNAGDHQSSGRTVVDDRPIDRPSTGGHSTGRTAVSDQPSERPSVGADPTSGGTAVSDRSSHPSSGETPVSDPPSVGPIPTIDRAADTLAESSVGPAGNTLTAFLLGAVAAELTRRRRQFQRHRLPGERMPSLSPEERELEAALRTAQADPSQELLESALRALAVSARAAGRPLPRVRVVRASGDGVELMLAEPEPPLAPFVRSGERRWTLDLGQLAELPTETAQDGSETEGAAWPEVVLPGLVTLGMDAEARVLVEMSEVGTLSVAGPAETLRPVVRGMAAELAFGRPRGGTERLIGAPSASVAGASGLGEIAVEPEPVRVEAAVRATLARSSGPSEESADPLLMVLAEQPVEALVSSRSGVGLITTQPVESASASLVVDGDGTATLQPEEVRLRPQTLGLREEVHLVGLLASADLPADPESGAVEAAEVAGLLVTAPVDAGHAGESATAPVVGQDGTEGSQQPRPVRGTEVPEISQPSAPTILLLGELRVVDPGGPAESTRIGRLAETAAFVLLNPDSRPSELQSALWPQRRSNPATCRQMISRTRTWLGRTESGEPFLEPFTATQGRLRLRAEVGSDWARFQELADAGFADPQDTARLTAALRLVRGRPFGSVAARELPWADLHLNDMLCLITDVAHELAVRLEGAGQYGAARDAVLRGLRTQTESEVLIADLARLQRHT